MDESTDREKQGDQQTEEVPVHDEQRAALQAPGEDMDEEQAETGEGVLDHAEHSDAPGPFGTS